MKRTKKTKLSLSTTTVRALSAASLHGAVGAYKQGASGYPRTCNGCPGPQTVYRDCDPNVTNLCPVGSTVIICV
jgi:hypothetical protein